MSNQFPCGVQVCEQAGVPLEVVPLSEAYWARVVSHSVAEVRAGRTPNPDVLCNSRCVDLRDVLLRCTALLVTSLTAQSSLGQGSPVVATVDGTQQRTSHTIESEYGAHVPLTKRALTQRACRL